jgi:hypothetical protein
VYRYGPVTKSKLSYELSEHGAGWRVEQQVDDASDGWGRAPRVTTQQSRIRLSIDFVKIGARKIDRESPPNAIGDPDVRAAPPAGWSSDTLRTPSERQRQR